jgi:probable rRNA maturation factor
LDGTPQRLRRNGAPAMQPPSALRAPARSRARSCSPLPPLRLSIVHGKRAAVLPARATLRRWVRMALESEAELSLVFVDARAARRLNRDYRGRDYPTNVLTFAYQLRPRVLADIVLCVPVVEREARAQGKSLRAHLAHLVFHGVLHAQGYDHERQRDAQAMQSREQALLARLRIADPYASRGEVRNGAA